MSSSTSQTNTKIYEDLKDIFENSASTMDEDPGVWLKLIRDKLYSMFCSPMKEDYIHEAFKWVSQLCMSVGDFSWISTDNNWTLIEAKMFSCIARLSLAELQILLPTIQRHLTCGDEPELEDGKILARSASSDDYDRLGNHLVILESVIKSLVKGQNFDDDEGASDETNNQLTEAIRGEELKNLLERLKEAMTLMCDYLDLVHKYWQDIIKQMDNEKFSSAEGALRIMSVWLSEDPGSFEPQCKRFIIDLIIKNLLLVDRPTLDDLLILALHSVCTNSEELMDELKRLSKHQEALEKYLDYVQREQSRVGKGGSRRTEKLFKLRCGLVKDLLT